MALVALVAAPWSSIAVGGLLVRGLGDGAMVEPLAEHAGGMNAYDATRLKMVPVVAVSMTPAGRQTLIVSL